MLFRSDYRSTVPEEDESGYLIFFVKASGDDETSISIPWDHDYSISGNNDDGFIVTVHFE